MNQNFLQCVRTAALAILLSATSAVGLAAQESGTILRGDVNGDGQISALDALAILAHTVGKTLPDGFTILPNGDNNGDGQITAMDALLGLSHTVGKDLSEYPIGEPLAPPTPVASITVEAGTGRVMMGGTLQLSAVARDSSNAAIAGAAVSWTTSDSTLATVSATGVVAGRSVGEVTITASSDSVSGEAAVTVVWAAAASSLEISPRTTTVLIDSTVVLSAQLLDGVGNPAMDRTITWTSLTPTVATVSDSGVVTGLAPGTTEVQATDGVLEATATVTVVPAASEANIKWVGGAAGGPTDWGIAENWDEGRVPGATDTVSIGSEAVHQPQLMQALRTIAGLVVDPDARLDIGANELQVSGRVDVWGEVVGTGKLTMQGVEGRASSVRGTLPNLTINGTTVIVARTTIVGSLELNSNSILSINGHSVSVSEDLIIEGGLWMRSAADSLNVRGNARFFNDAQVTEAVITAGTMVVGGDFAVEISISSAANPFPATGQHLLVLDGTRRQTVSNQGLSTVTIQELDLANAAGGVEFTAQPTGRFNVSGRFDALTPVAISGDGRVNALQSFITLTGGSVTLRNLAVRGVLSAGSDFQPDTLTLLGIGQRIPAGNAYHYQNVVVAGSAAFTGTTDIAGGLTIGCLTVLSECSAGAAALDLAGRTVTVGGDLRQTTTQPGAPLYMRDALGKLTIGGGLLGPVGQTSGAIEFTVGADQWTAGTLQVGGDLFARGVGATGQHHTILNGLEEQELRVISGFSFMHLAVRDSAGVVMNDTLPHLGRQREAGVGGDFNIYSAVTLRGTGRLNVAGNVQTAAGSSVELGAISVGSVLQADGAFTPDTAEFNNPGTAQTIQNLPDYNTVVVKGKAAFGGSMTFKGSLIVLPGGELNVEGRHVRVTEKLKVWGILRMQNAADTLTVMGDSAVFYPRGDALVKAYATRGVLRVAGHLKSDSTGFYPTRDHRVVSLGRSGSVLSGTFQELEIAGVADTLGWSPGVIVRGVDLRGSLIARNGAGKIRIEQLTVDADVDLTQTDTISILGPTAIGGDLTIRNLVASGSDTRVEGDLTLVDGAYLWGRVVHAGKYIEEGTVSESARHWPVLAGIYQVKWVQQPTATVAGEPFEPVLSVEVVDSAGVRLTTGSTMVTLVSTGTTLAGSLRVSTVDGVATFPAVAPETAGGNQRVYAVVSTPTYYESSYYSQLFEVTSPPEASP